MILTTSASSLTRFQSCELAHYYGKVEGLSLVERPAYLDRGTLIHCLLEKHYNYLKNNQDHPESAIPYLEIIENVCASAGLAAVNKTQLAISNTSIITECVEVYRKYAMHYAGESYRTIAVEQPFSYVAYEDDEDKVLVEGRIDWVPETLTGEILVVDHKSVTKKGYYTSLSNQLRIYAMVTGASTVTINEVGFQKSPEFRRVSVSYMPGQIEEFQDTILRKWAIKLLNKAKKEQIEKNFIPNPSSCKFCDYRPLCEASASARDWKKEQLYIKTATNFDVFGDE